MKTPMALGIESYLVVLDTLFESGNWVFVSAEKQITLRQKGTSELWTPWTAAVAELISVRVGLSEEERFGAIEHFVTTSDQVRRIIDAEDGENERNESVRVLRAKILDKVSRCNTQEELMPA